MKLPAYPFLVVRILAGVVIAVPLDFTESRIEIERFATLIANGAKRRVWLAMSDQLTISFDVQRLGRMEFKGDEAVKCLPTSQLAGESQSLFLFVEKDKLPFRLA